MYLALMTAHAKAGSALAVLPRNVIQFDFASSCGDTCESQVPRLLVKDEHCETSLQLEGELCLVLGRAGNG